MVSRRLENRKGKTVTDRRTLVAAGSLPFALALLGVGRSAAAEAPIDRGVGGRVANFTLEDTAGKVGRLSTASAVRGPSFWSSWGPTARSGTSTSPAWWS